MIQRERAEQVLLVRWFRLQWPHILIVASANGGSRNILEARNLKASGIVAGIPDLQIFKASRGYNGLLIEMKAPSIRGVGKGRVSPQQKECIDYLNAQNYCAKVAWGFEEGRDIVNWYFDTKLKEQ